MGNYYIGQTPFLPTNNTSLLVALENPADSRVNIYLNVSTITSMQALGFVEFYLGPNLEGKTTSNLFSVTNTNFEKTPKGIIKYFEPAILPTNSTSIFTRYIPNPGTEIVDGGQIILSPGTSLRFPGLLPC